MRILIAVILALLINAPEGLAQEARNYRYLSTNFSLTDVNVARLVGRLRRIGVRIPFDLTGDVSTRLNIQVPVNALRDTQAYRFDGTISSPRLQVADWELEDVQMVVTYREGVMNLEPLTFQIPETEPNAPPPGTFRGTGRLELVPRGDLTLNLQMNEVSARSVGQFALDESPITAGRLAGRLEANVAAQELRDVSAWEVTGQFSATNLTVAQRVLQRASFQLAVSEGEMTLRDITATTEGARLSGTAQANLTGATAYTSNLQLSVTDPGPLLGVEDVVEIENPIAATARLTGRLAPFSFQANGQGTLPATSVGRLDINSGRFDYSFDEEQFAVRDLQVRLYEGQVTGSATLPREGDALASAELRLQSPLDVNQLLDDLSDQDLDVSGRVQGNVTARVPRQQLDDPEAWEATARLSIQDGRAYGLAVSRAAVQLGLEDGVVSLAETGLTWANSVMDLSGTLELDAPRNFSANVDLVAGDLRDLNQLSEEVRLPLDVRGEVRIQSEVEGQLEDFEWEASGTVRSQQLQFDKVQVDQVTADFAADPQELTLRQFAMLLYNGRATGRGTLPLEADRDGDFQFNWQNIDVGQVVQEYLETDTPVTGVMAGQARATLDSQAPEADRQWDFNAGFQIPTITIGEVEAGRLRGNVTRERQRWEYAVTGKVFEGDFELRGELPPPEEPPEEPAERTQRTLPGEGRVELQGVRLQPIWQAFVGDAEDRRLTGALNLVAEWSPDDRRSADATGTVTFVDVTWEGRRLSDRLEGAVQLRRSRLVATNIRGAIGGAQLQAEVVWGFGDDRRRVMRLRLRNLSLPFVAEITPLPEGMVEGRADLETTIVPGPLWHADLRVRVQTGVVQGLAVQSVLLPLRGSFLPSLERGEFVLRSGAASLAGGRVQGRVNFGWGERNRVNGRLEFREVEMETFVQQAFAADLPGDGRLKGTVELEGNNIRQWEDMVVLLDAELSRCLPRRLPVISAIEPIVRTVSFSRPVDEGHVTARWSQNVWTIQQMTLTGPMLELYTQGTISAYPSQWRLNLEVTVRTGRRSVDRRVAHVVGGRLGNRMVGFLADRLVQINVRGTLRRPIIRVKSVPLVEFGSF